MLFAQLAIAPDGHHRSSSNVERHIRMVVQKRDGTSETLTPHEFEQKQQLQERPRQGAADRPVNRKEVGMRKAYPGLSIFHPLVTCISEVCDL